MNKFITLKTSVLELIVLAMFVLYIALPLKTPYYLALILFYFGYVIGFYCNNLRYYIAIPY